jgi:uncharacterized protein (DUF58 family)
VSSTLDRAALFDAEFLEAVQQLRLVAKRVPHGGLIAEQRSKDQGAGIEFADHRPYSPGDDIRAIDWNLYRRLGKVFLRLFEETRDLPLYLCPDISSSAFAGDPPRALAGLRAAFALGAIACDQHDAVGLFPFAERLRPALKPGSGGGRLERLAEHLLELGPRGTTDFRRSFAELDAFRLRRGLVVVISDGFDPGGAEAVLEGLRPLRHSLVFVQLTRRSDAEPELSGDVRLVDCESGEQRDLSIGGSVLARYREAQAAFQQTLTEGLERRGAGHVQLDVEADIVAQLSQLFTGGRLEVHAR